MLTKIRAAFEGATVADKNIALRLAHDEIERLRAALEQIARECNALNKGPVAVSLARAALASEASSS
jgi:hypothetical protein